MTRNISQIIWIHVMNQSGMEVYFNTFAISFPGYQMQSAYSIQ